MANADLTREPDNGPDTTPGIPPSRPVPLSPQPVADTSFRPPAQDGLSGLSIGLGAAIVTLGLYMLFNWPGWRSAPAPVVPVAATAAPPAATAPAAAAPVPVPNAPPVTDPGPVAAAGDTATGVHRCEKTGEVVYTDGPCPAGMRGAPVDTRTALHVEGQRGATLFLCRGAGRFWSVVHCQHRGAEVVSMHTVPADLPLAEQILFAQNQAALARTARPARPPALASGPPAPPDAAALKAAECRHLDEAVAALDAYARQPLTGGEQDRVARQRRELRDQQFRLRCGR